MYLHTKNPLSYRIWSKIAVKCKHQAEGCAWTGSVSDYRSHKQSCPQIEKTWQQIDVPTKVGTQLKTNNRGCGTENSFSESGKLTNPFSEIFSVSTDSFLTLGFDNYVGKSVFIFNAAHRAYYSIESSQIEHFFWEVRLKCIPNYRP